jgi:Helix-turn-helix domain
MNATISFDGIDDHLRQLIREEIHRAQNGNGGYRDTKGAADYLGCSVATINGLVQRGELVPVRRKPHRLYSLESLDEYACGAQS